MTVATNFLWFHACVATETELRLVRRQSSGTGRGERHCDRDTVPTTICAPSERDEAEQLTETHTARLTRGVSCGANIRADAERSEATAANAPSATTPRYAAPL